MVTTRCRNCWGYKWTSLDMSWVMTTRCQYWGGVGPQVWCPGWLEGGEVPYHVNYHMMRVVFLSPLWTDRCLCKRYIPATSFTGGNNKTDEKRPGVCGGGGVGAWSEGRGGDQESSTPSPLWPDIPYPSPDQISPNPWPDIPSSLWPDVSYCHPPLKRQMPVKT